MCTMVGIVTLHPNQIKKTGVFVLHENDGKLYIYSNKSVDMGDYSPFWLWKISKHKEAYYGVAYKEKRIACFDEVKRWCPFFVNIINSTSR